jgi:endogenous inhibitor of DNA gyrase (YacG/DUF329 family)
MDRRTVIEDAHLRGVCPRCGRNLDKEHRVGSGQLSDGTFCSTECQAVFHANYYGERRDWGIPSNN